MDENLEIRAIKISNHYDVMEPMLEALHVNELDLFEKTAAWGDIREAYMRHVISMQEEYEGVCLVAFIAGLPCGFIFGYLDVPDDSRIEIYEGPEFYVSDGFIVKEHRGSGVYKALNDVLESICVGRGVKRISRHTLNNNVLARKFMERQGYAVTRLLYEKWL